MASLRPLELDFRSKNKNSLESRLKLTSGKNTTAPWVKWHTNNLEFQSVSQSLYFGLKITIMVNVFYKTETNYVKIEHKNNMEAKIFIFVNIRIILEYGRPNILIMRACQTAGAQQKVELTESSARQLSPCLLGRLI